MRVLFATSFFPPYGIGGTEEYTKAIAESLVCDGHEVEILSVGDWDVGRRHWNGQSEHIANEIRVRRLHFNWKKARDPNQYLYANPVAAEQMSQALREFRPDILHLTSPYTLSASIVRVGKKAEVPTIVTLTDFWFLCPRHTLLKANGTLCDGQTSSWDCLKCKLADSGLHRFTSLSLPSDLSEPLYSRVSRQPRLSRLRSLRGIALDMEDRKRYLEDSLALADYVIAPSEFLKTTFQRIWPDLRIAVIPYGHDLSWLESYPDKSQSNLTRIGYIGQISNLKGVHLLLNAFLMLPPETSASLKIFGDLSADQQYASQLERMALRHQDIHLKGKFTHENLGQILSQIDVLVVPSLWYENNPLVIQEAFAAKTPVIATNLGGMSEFVEDGVNGLLFRRDEASDLANKLLMVINNRSLLSRLKLGIGQVKPIKTAAKELEVVYGQILEASKERTPLASQ